MKEVRNVQYQVTVQVLTYNSDPEKLRQTLRSIIMQKDIAFQIVISDDGSARPPFEEARTFFAENDFHDYKFVENPVNRGTVWNYFSAVEASDGTYVKPFSPGDLLSANDVLAEWVAQTRNHQADASIADAFYYGQNDQGVYPVRAKTHPQDVSCYQKGNQDRIRMNYLFGADLFLGAAVLCRRETALAYLRELCGKVIYAEDGMFRLMAYDGVSVYYYPREAIFYEYGPGISTCGSPVWQERLRKDWLATAQILADRCVTNKRFDRYLKASLTHSQSGLWFKIKKVLLFPELLMHRLKCKWMPRWSPERIPLEYLKTIMKPDIN